MATAQPSKEVTTVQVGSVSFGWYSDDEIRRLSVKKVVNPVARDNLGNALPGGLLDPAMGPTEPHASCTTCGLLYTHCPGHFGHIELAVPVYNPLVFGHMYKLLRCTCLHCFSLKMDADEAGRYRRRLELLAQGRLVEAAEQVSGGGAAAAKAVAKMEDGFADADIFDGGGGAEAVQLPTPKAAPHDPTKPSRKRGREASEWGDDVEAGDGGATARGRSGRITAHTIEAMRATVAELMKRMPTGNCKNCGAVNPAIRREGASKIFQMPLSAKLVTQNRMNKTPVLGALSTASAARRAEAAALEAGAAAAAAAEALQRRLQRQKAAGLVPEGDDGIPGKLDLDAEDEGKDEVLAAAEAALEDAKRETARVAAGQGDAGAGGDRPRYLTPSEVQEVMRRMWARNPGILNLLFAVASGELARKGVKAVRRNADGYQMFFLNTVAVAPNKFRPSSKMGDMSFEHPQNVVLKQILEANLDIVSSARAATDTAVTSSTPGVGASPEDEARVELQRSLRAWLELQADVNALIDSTTAPEKGVSGIRQQLEKKEGLFRKNMMGKRVNFACRSVISPDPYIGTGEIGVPPYFAMRLSFPERVTPHNVEQLRQAVRNGPGVMPGAVAVEDELGRVISLATFTPERREAVAKTLLSRSAASVAGGAGAKLAGSGGAPAALGGGKIVYRHLKDGDVMLTNRQPTLHKPGMMSHRARILKGERTIRMHYANCATFNADFDGDEINLHFPQDHLGRAEGYNVVQADEQYVVPTDGAPIRGLIQDHVAGGVLLTKRDTFLTRAQFTQVVYAACSPSRPGMTDGFAFPLPAPAVLKPEQLWTGKQVITAVLGHITRGLPPVSLTAKTKTSPDAFGRDSGEGVVEVQRGELVAGVLDKAQFGQYGIVHSMQELYGNQVAGRLLSCFSRLLTYFLQHHGFTCGISDVLLQHRAEEERAALLRRSEATVLRASAAAAGIADAADLPDGELRQREAEVEAALSRRYRSDRGFGVGYDRAACSAINPLSSEVVKACLPGGQLKPFLHNCMALMTGTGAKGSQVNFSQISCLLGQQELEGRRVPRMASGKTLPCFAPFDAGARSGGFIGDRFLSGLRPQEYYFHCMAGRDGLVDTTVKTSRSGYLQRCLVKNLEPLRVHYDSTVRDDADGSVVQFQYGEDGVDVMSVGYLRAFTFLARNAYRFAQKLDFRTAADASERLGLGAEETKARTAMKRRQKQLRGGRGAADEKLPLLARKPTGLLGVSGEEFHDALSAYVRDNPDGLLRPQDEKSNKESGRLDPLSRRGFQQLMELKYMRSLAAPGEAVGVLAAQSVGEPSTQMTLNTFHMAGRGEANVTLGIPRLRELLMTAAQTIKTPVMVLPPRRGSADPLADMQALARRLRRISLGEVVADMAVSEAAVAAAEGHPGGLGTRYRVRLRLFPAEALERGAQLSFPQVAAAFEKAFVPLFQSAVKAQLAKLGSAAVSAVQLSKIGEGSAPIAAGGRDEGEADSKRLSEKVDVDENAELDEENAEGKLRFSGGHGEAVTYDDGDDEDRRIRAAAARADDALDDEDAGGEEDEGPGEDLTGEGASGKGSGPRDEAPAKKEKRNKGGLDIATECSEAEGTLEASLTLPLGTPKLLMSEIAQRVAADTMLRDTPGILRATVVDGSPPQVEAEGINFPGVWRHQDLIDANSITSNDVGAILATLGVEAARATVVAEVVKVFGVYGIGVDKRHLGLIGDYMMHQGGYRACSRLGIESSASPFLKITFETASHFLTEATLRGETDELTTPASRIVMGRSVELGTGCMDLTQRLDTLGLGGLEPPK